MKEEPELAGSICSTQIFAFSHSRLVVICRVVVNIGIVVVFIVNAIVGRKGDLTISDRVIDVLRSDGRSDCDGCDVCYCCRSRSSNSGS